MDAKVLDNLKDEKMFWKQNFIRFLLAHSIQNMKGVISHYVLSMMLREWFSKLLLLEFPQLLTPLINH
jgi:hypothetical protein